ncbi:MAG TPA: D-alanine--D-serine ligase VanG [Candidatus Scatomorpha intestinavium]|uniref:D-alanine--D-alanine ligase n=1 Tax=Candidatus Scatomorpha intestinavium TaxID=2840922 RepID=A0A9D1CTY3_9FIRM|nr:D-alanine--D-serine ligase VanG [Candidatus Scatomorpha intestinavium]
MEKKKIAVIFGGCSPEHTVSLTSAAAVIRHIDTEKYEVVQLGITEGGEWFRFYGSPDDIEANTWRADRTKCIPAVISPDRDQHGILEFRMSGVRTTRLDAAFPVLHGRNGEDGTVQGLCELAGIPLIGCGTLSSALCMDKDRAHKLVMLAGIAVPRSVLLEKLPASPELATLAEDIGYPLFVKPVRAGSSFGVTRVESAAGLRAAVREAFRYDTSVLIEEAVPGFEVGCAVMGNGNLITGRADEIELSGGYFDFEEKYTLKTSKIHMPARVDEPTERRLRDTACRIYRTLGCRGFARVDMFLTPGRRIVFNEVNTIPGFTSHSRFPKMMSGVGYDFAALVDALISLGLEV